MLNIYKSDKQNYDQMFSIIQSAMFGKDCELSDDINLEWLHDEMSGQSMLLLVASKVMRIPEKNSNQYDAIREKWNSVFAQLIYFNTRLLSEEKKLIACLKERRIPFVVIKGSAAATYYHSPQLRMCGDIDILVTPDFLLPTVKAVENMGYTVTEWLKENKRHVQLRKGNVEVEIHQRFFTLTGEETLKEDYFLYDGIKNRQNKAFAGYEIPVLPEKENGLILLQHMKQHIPDGMGLRQLCDWVAYVNSVCNDSFWDEGFGKLTKECKLDKIAKCATKLGKKYFGLNSKITWCDDAEDRICEELLDYLLFKGNFGRRYRETKEEVSVVLTHRLSIWGWFKYLQNQGCEHWGAIKKHKWLKLFAWLYQLIRYAIRGFGVIKDGSLHEQMAEGLQRREMFRKLDIEDLF